jgi:hypothetical protein
MSICPFCYTMEAFHAAILRGSITAMRSLPRVAHGKDLLAYCWISSRKCQSQVVTLDLVKHGISQFYSATGIALVFMHYSG